MSTRNFLGELQKTFSQSKVLTKAALKVRNQCNAIIANYIGKMHEGAESGEHWFLEKYVGSGPATLFDVGANRGNWTKAARGVNREATIYSYEPDPRAASQYRASFQNERDIFFKEMALGSEAGKLTLFLADESTEHSTAAPLIHKEYTSSTVQVSTVDAQIEHHQIDYVDLLKVDVEGYESDVLKGTAEALSEEKVGCIQFEYGENWKAAGSTLTHVCSVLENHGFRVFLLRPTCLKVTNIDEIGEYFSYSNYIAIHKSKLGKVSGLISNNPLI
jgi:FkbM family methyltransferase